MPPALAKLGYAPWQIEDMVRYSKGAATLNGCPHVNTGTLKAKGFTDEVLKKIDDQLAGAFEHRLHCILAGPVSGGFHAGVVDFGHGAVAMYVAYVFLLLRSDGTLELPWIWLPHEIDLGGALATGPALAIALVYAALLGAAMYWVIYRPLRSATALSRVCASVGSMLDRLLHHGHVLNCGPRSWRTKTAVAEERA